VAVTASFLFGGILVWVVFSVVAAKQTLAHLTSSFEQTSNSTELPDYKVNGLLVHTNDGWADIEVLERSRELGFVSMSYIRRDISRHHERPIFFDPNYRDIPWMRDDLIGTGIILDPDAEFVPLCFFITDAASVNRHHFGCGGYIEVESQKFDWIEHFARYGLDKIPSRLSHESQPLADFSSVYVPEQGIQTCNYFGIEDAFDYDARLLTDWRTTCAFAIDKKSFALALDFSRKYIRDYNEFLVREWSEGASPVAATFYVASANSRVISAEDTDLFRTKALEIQHDYYARTGQVVPVYEMNLDAFQSLSLPLLEYRFADNNPFSLFATKVRHAVSTGRASSRQ